ncbi:MAG: AbrB/MazE/SpoVT family DNA-binding domain-containing protein [Candidatus Micrarchaeota archaeon]
MDKKTNDAELTSVTAKGQIVIPKDLRDRVGIHEKDTLACFDVKDFIVLKKIEIPSLEKEFKEIARRISKAAKAKGITEADVIRAVRKRREGSS